MTCTVTLDRDEDGVWVAECPAMPRLTLGATRDCLEICAERGTP